MYILQFINLPILDAVSRKRIWPELWSRSCHFDSLECRDETALQVHYQPLTEDFQKGTVREIQRLAGLDTLSESPKSGVIRCAGAGDMTDRHGRTQTSVRARSMGKMSDFFGRGRVPRGTRGLHRKGLPEKTETNRNVKNPFARVFYVILVKDFPFTIFQSPARPLQSLPQPLPFQLPFLRARFR
jgi:hypothetical protein